ncbi:MAG: ABC transporter permease [Actinomycetota bacterium]|nr:ABC transporter permease [Actinomycetota bacterium]
MSAGLEKRNNKLRLKRQTPLFILLFMILVISIFNKEFLTLQSFINLMQQVSAVGIVALGAMFVLIAGGIDLTAGYGLAMIGMTAATIYTMFSEINGIFILILITLITGVILGLVNGFVVAKLKIIPFIATLAIMSVTKGLSLVIGGGNMVVFKNQQIIFIGQGKLFGFLPVPFLIFILVGVLIHLILTKTKLGLYTYAIGSNEGAVRFAGIRIVNYKVLIYIMAGICTGIGALLTITKIGMATPSMYGSTLLDALAATIIGGTSLSGGRGNVLGTIVGVFIIVVVSTALVYFNVPPEMQDFFKGMVIFIAVGIDAYSNKYYLNT